MRIIETKVYSFDELSKEAKEKALEELRYINVDYENWADDTIEQIKRIGSYLGIEIDQVLYSGFSSQGDGACFEPHPAACLRSHRS